MGRVERIFVDESRVAAPGPDVAEREYVFGRFVELIDLGGGNTVSVQNLTEGFATVDDLLFEPVVVGGSAVLKDGVYDFIGIFFGIRCRAAASCEKEQAC